MQKKDFFLCGFTGWCLEILWTGLHSLVTGHFTMMGKTSLLMFPVYGLAALIRPAYYKLARFPVMVRGIIYSCGIFFVEFLSGSFFQKLHICPWDYSHVPLQYKGLCSSVVFYRSLFRMASSTKSSESLLKISQLYYMITGRNLISSK